MRRPTNVQIIEQAGVPAFAVIPYADFLNIFPDENHSTIPHDVVGMMVKDGCNLIKAWRKYLGFTQKEIAKKAGISQSALSQMEKKDNELRTPTLEKLAAALNLNVDQLTD